MMGCKTNSICVWVSPPVPTPNLTLSVPSGPLYEGTSLTLTSNITLPDTVDSEDVTVDVQWTPLVPVDYSDRVMLSAASSMRFPFISTLIFSPLSMSDSGQYSCRATATSLSHYITDSSQGHSSLIPLTVTGMYVIQFHNIDMACVVLFIQLCLLLMSPSHSLETLLLV